MSEENVARYHRISEAFSRRDLSAFLAHFDPEVDFFPRSAELDGRSFRGHEGIRSWWESMFAVFSEYRAEIEEVRDLGPNLTFGRVRLGGLGMESSVPTEQMHFHVVEWRDGLVTRWRSYRSEADALEAAGGPG